MSVSNKIDRFAQILQGRRKESLADKESWAQIETVTHDCDDVANGLLASKLQVLYESVADYFIRLTSVQERIRDFEDVMPMVSSLDRGMELRLHSDYDRALESRGAYKAFEDYILKHSPEEDATLMSLAFCILFGYRNCICCFPSKAVVEHKEKFVSTLAKCARASDRFHPWLTQGLARSVVALVTAAISTAKNQANLDDLQPADEISKLIIEHDLAQFTFRQLKISRDEPWDPRKENYVSCLLRIADFCPSFVEASRTDAYIECAASLLRTVGLNFEKHSAHTVNSFFDYYKCCATILGAKLFREQLVPGVFKDTPDSFLTSLYHDPKLLLGSWRNSLEPAAGAFQVGRFNHHELLVPIIIDVFKQDYIYISRDSWDFLHGAFAVPKFKEEYFKNAPGGCDLYTIEFLRSVISADWRPFNMRYPNRPSILLLNLEELKLRGYMVSMEVALERCERCHLATFLEGACSNFRCKFMDKTKQDTYECKMHHFSYDKDETRKRVLDSLAVEVNDTINEIEREQERFHAREVAKTSAAAKVSVEKDSSPMMMSCDTCGRRAADMMMCGRCQKARYCNRDCQRADWKKGHKQICQNSLS